MVLQSEKSLVPSFDPNASLPESSHTSTLLQSLKLEPHPEGGYFVVTDYNDTFHVPNPFVNSSKPSAAGTPASADDQDGLRSSDLDDDSSRAASTTIYYYLTPKRSLGVFHRNRARTVHTLHKGRGRYVIIHADEVAGGLSSSDPSNSHIDEHSLWTGKARIETFVVGPNVLKGERLQWIVPGGKYKSSLLLPDDEDGETSEGLLISETVIPGFEWADHDYMTLERLGALVSEEQEAQMKWMIKESE